jgi:hypothetical protein
LKDGKAFVPPGCDLRRTAVEPLIRCAFGFKRVQARPDPVVQE